jgi:hypothetical protein
MEPVIVRVIHAKDTAASVLLDKILGRSDCAELNGEYVPVLQAVGFPKLDVTNKFNNCCPQSTPIAPESGRLNWFDDIWDWFTTPLLGGMLLLLVTGGSHHRLFCQYPSGIRAKQ